MTLTPEQAVAANRAWYHVLELAPGVTTPGQIDHRKLAQRILPQSLKGKRALDVATFDGFWAFQLEQRGADVTAIDLDDFSQVDLPPLRRKRLERDAGEWGVQLGHGFRLAAGVLGSDARRVTCSLYELSPDVVGGEVDFAFSGDVLIHLRDPVGALERVLDTLVPGGALRVLEPISGPDTLRSPRTPVAAFQADRTDFNWWYPNMAAVRAWLAAAGFVEPRRVALARPPARGGMKRWHVVYEARRPVSGA